MDPEKKIPTPVSDFAERYAASSPVRLHMPGHKGLGGDAERLDLTEIPGADSLYEADGILAESEKTAGALFGCDTFYSAEGSTQCIKAMLFLAVLHAKSCGRRPVILAARNVHRAFVDAAALLDLDVVWLMPKGASILSCPVTPDDLTRALFTLPEPPSALYLTSPDYLGTLQDISALSQICRENGMLCLVDNAHGAYLRFLTPSLLPTDLGADLTACSAHKTLPALTGAAYLQIRSGADPFLKENSRRALALFGSTSPSYLILESLDRLNPLLARLPEILSRRLPKILALSERLSAAGYLLTGDEPLKLTLRTRSFGYTGTALSALLAKQNVIAEFADPDHLVLMIGVPNTTDEELAALEAALLSVPRLAPLPEETPVLPELPERALSIREAAFSDAETLPVEACEGRILAHSLFACPPAVPPVVCGEMISRQAVSLLRYYGIRTCTVVRERTR